jgi:hypothetical protein
VAHSATVALPEGGDLIAGRPPLGLIVEITTADGTRFQWGKGSNVPGDVPQNVGFSTRLGDGFADSSSTLSRRIDRDWPDINLYDDYALIGMDGSIAYEGRIAANPRSISASHSMNVVCAGWMAHTRDRKMDPQVYVDRDPSHFQEATLTRRIAMALVPSPAGDYTASTTGGITFLGASGQAISINSDAEVMYVLPSGVGLGKVMYKGTQANTTNVEAATLFTDDNEAFSSATSTSLTLDSTLRTATPTVAERYVMMRALATATHTPAAGSPFSRSFSLLALYGNHGLTTRANGTDPDGLYASDVIADIIARFCPKLNTAGIQATTYVIPHLVFLEPTDPFDAISSCNAFHRWQFGVWENKTFTYGPTDLTDYDWAVDYFDPGVTVDLQGDSTDDGAFNGICVNYTDLATGNPARITPVTNTELADLDPENPANRHGIPHYDELTLSSPTTSDGAAQIGRMALAEKNTPKGQGSITIKGHLKDRAGHWQQAWKVRAGDRVAITSSTSLSDRPRLISETSWDQDSLTLTLSVESIPQRVDAFLDRLSTALAAAGLT